MHASSLIMENTFIILKPDCVAQKTMGQVMTRFESKGYRVRAAKMFQFDDALLREHYAHHADKPYFPEIANFMKSSPVLALVLEGKNVIEGVRNLLGPTDSNKAAPGTIRGDLGSDIMLNIAHASDGPDTAKEEIARFFKAEELH